MTKEIKKTNLKKKMSCQKTRKKKNIMFPKFKKKNHVKTEQHYAHLTLIISIPHCLVSEKQERNHN